MSVYMSMVLDGVILTGGNPKYGITAIIRTLVNRIANYPDRLAPADNFVANSAKLICVEITDYRVEYSTVKCYGCLELQIRRGRKV
jgi:hypothetical protein